jgi:hypothetical protein
MRGFLVLAVGICLILLSFIGAVMRTKHTGAGDGIRWLLRMYVILTGASLLFAGLLCFAARLERMFSVNAYGFVFDALSTVLLAGMICGVVLIIQSYKWLLNVVSFMVGGALTFGEFLGR